MWIQSGFHHLCVHSHSLRVFIETVSAYRRPYRSAQGVQITAEGACSHVVLSGPTLSSSPADNSKYKSPAGSCESNLPLIQQTEGKQTFVVCLANCNLSAGVYMYVIHYNNSTTTEGSIKTIMLIILHRGAVTDTFFICASRPSLV